MANYGFVSDSPTKKNGMRKGKDESRNIDDSTTNVAVSMVWRDVNLFGSHHDQAVDLLVVSTTTGSSGTGSLGSVTVRTSELG